MKGSSALRFKLFDPKVSHIEGQVVASKFCCTSHRFSILGPRVVAPYSSYRKLYCGIKMLNFNGLDNWICDC